MSEKVFDITQEDLLWVEELLKGYGRKKEELLQILRDVQNRFGFIPMKVQIKISEYLDIPLSEVYSIVTFYAFFSLKPKGKYRISVCKGTACYVRGSEKIIEKLTQYLKIQPGDTTDDGLFSIDIVRCLGACGLGPVMMINEDVYARLKPDDIPKIISKYEPPFKNYEEVMKEQEEIVKSRKRAELKPSTKLVTA
ncbi:MULTISPECIES: NADH-quinone oxidoreductase subunit NuoE [Thermovenabulum]|uniref:NADP-reducing hydrogenase subunit HndA n=1 Tax=Thermovenabulum gondwanense TaxID=520767 RepID=A0A162MZV1_9FIRM|nr:NADH-quinone oxidoreductase subunit NuoE [Thermovenabulum gondwanense]KYO68612.1 NADP-reducing hydrogenase subunit HndA [Thermovenabulum gondwanense]